MLNLHFDADGLIPVVVQDDQTNEVLLLAFMNEEALQRTRETRLAHFWSRSRRALWLKGESSGQMLDVVSLSVNCEENSLLLRVTLRGVAACHAGYRSCYYRHLNDQGHWETSAPRLFDPAEVYGLGGVPPASVLAGVGGRTASLRAGRGGALAHTHQRIYRAYEYLRDHDLEAISGTSRRLRQPDLAVLQQRASDELAELAGVLAGTHSHTTPREDAILEGRQVCYWLCLLAAAARMPYAAFSPDAALQAGYESGATLDGATLADFTQRPTSQEPAALLATIHAGLRLVGGTCRALGIPLLTLAERELTELQEKSYLKDTLAS
jgi:phosphoribosyl-AMP cyclohydrolase